MRKVIWVLIERPTPPEEPVIVGSSNDEDFIDTIIKSLRSVSRDQTYWKEAVDLVVI